MPGITLGFAPPGTGVPPQLTVNQSTVDPACGTADSEDVWPMQIRSGDATALDGKPGLGLTVTVSVAQFVLVQVVVVLRARA
jgi:hypothetical protein